MLFNRNIKHRYKMSTRAHSNALLNEPSVNKYKYSYGGAAGGFYGEGAKFNKQTAKWVPPLGPLLDMLYAVKE